MQFQSHVISISLAIAPTYAQGKNSWPMQHKFRLDATFYYSVQLDNDLVRQ